MSGDIVLVIWEDACNTSAWVAQDAWEPQTTLEVRSVGYLQHEDHGENGFIELVQNIADMGGENAQVAGRMSIPKRCIKSVTVLVEEKVDTRRPACQNAFGYQQEPSMQRQVRSASDADLSVTQRILVVGPTGSGKSALIRTLPGRKFVFVFDPNTLPTIQGCPDCDIVEFYPDVLDVDMALKGFNKGAKDDVTKGKKKEPKLYEEWRDYFNEWVDSKAYENYDWLVFDSMTFVAKSMMDRQLFINNRYGDIEELGDYRVVGSKLTDVFSSIAGLGVNIFATGHKQEFQDDKTKKIVTQIFLPGKARTMLPLSNTNVWETFSEEGPKGQEYKVRTVPDRRGLQDIRTSIRGLQPIEDVTVKDFGRATEYGIGALLKKGNVNALHKRTA